MLQVYIKVTIKIITGITKDDPVTEEQISKIYLTGNQLKALGLTSEQQAQLDPSQMEVFSKYNDKAKRSELLQEGIVVPAQVDGGAVLKEYRAVILIN